MSVTTDKNTRPDVGALLESAGASLRRRLAVGLPSHMAEQADDLFQEVSCDAVRQWPRHEWNGPMAAHAWLGRIADGKLADWWRRYGRRAAGGDRAAPTPIETLPAPGPTPSSAVARGEDAARLAGLLTLLAPVEAEVLRLHFHDDLPWDEIGRRVGKSAGAAKMIKQRAVGKLAALAAGGAP